MADMDESVRLAIMEALEQQLREREANLVELRNKVHQFNMQAIRIRVQFTDCLPPEIVAEIFEFCIPDVNYVSSKYKLSAPLVLSAVCRSWRDIAHSMPRLWNVLPLYLRDSDSGPLPGPLLVKEWIGRAGQLPLSIYFSVFEALDGPENLGVAVQIINVFNQYSIRWRDLKYGGPPSLLSHFSSDMQGLPQLRSLSLETRSRGPDHGITTYDEPLKLRPKKLKALTILAIIPHTLDFDWCHLTQLDISFVALADYFEVLRRAPLLTKCSFRWEATHYTTRHELPPKSIVCSGIRSLYISAPLYEKIIERLICPSLKDLKLLKFYNKTVEMPLIVDFLRKSGCSLEVLSLEDKVNLSQSHMALLCQAIPSLQILHLELSLASTPSHFLKLLAALATIDGQITPQYLPSLSSLYFAQDTFYDWKILPDVFGTSALRPTD
ncbi:hypothetical protein BJ912DRAFT_164547 [Pholiota molesta]|nr:hypothetical protein BJ912DRAFT_164547 [Pholiota molesta]